MKITYDLPSIKGEYKFDFDCSKISWLRVGGRADVLFSPYDEEDLQHFLQQICGKIPITIIGLASNILIRDKGIRGVTIRLGKRFREVTMDDSTVTVGCAASGLQLANFGLENSIADFEFFSGIPGTIGGMLVMNAGAFGNDVSKMLKSATCLNLMGQKKVINVEEFGYSYRSNSLKEQHIFVKALFHRKHGAYEEIARKIQEIGNTRKITQPSARTAGSTFKNPTNHKAWALIKACNTQMRVGNAYFSSLHSNFIVTEDGATATDVEALISLAKNAVKDKFNIMLKEEIVILGEE
ncbi:UDP-N-acetylenolpyruvoylglucosamine reductase [Candidatus Fokinia solitaria]|uniref:UDP-N-acetylenolpyruvoylglucosamine reductase n=1 Tax=Candidatus Fokinia solitaria TaxID=1802984 RepID=A0A2U8BSE6_9RICK|nr:UDP-N-acetylmuramate dehydrogenase [Candidatus Fokinia solitaria]AWD33262.1 UDP-N-acetylenolpyruvoylglucosamine reductase [Candidatus Fokinia solitaria]